MHSDEEIFFNTHSTSHTPVLSVTNLTKTFTSGIWPFNRHHYTAVNDVSFELKRGEVLGLLGPNGAGKTTTIQMLLGTLTSTSGSIQYFGNDFARDTTTALKKIGSASGYDRLPGRLTIQENLDVVARIYGLSKDQRLEKIEKLLTFFGLWEMRTRQTGALSAGQATCVMLAKAFIADPQIVLLDEPTASLDPDVAEQVRAFILQEQKESGTAILITSHNMQEVTELCDRVLVLKGGSIIADDTPEVLAQSIAKVRLHLTITSNIDEAIDIVSTFSIACRTNNPCQFTLEVDEHEIAQLLATLAEKKIMYSHIAIDTPTLEDYFLNIAR